jgi:excinuclease ABC subunit C
VAATFHFDTTLAFSAEHPEHAEAILRSIPALPGVFALRGHNPPEGQPAQPYLTRTADLRRRVKRLLNPPESQSKRLNLRDKVAAIDYTVTGSEFESTLTLYHAAAALFGYPEARRRLKLTTPFFLRFTAENAFPRVYSTNRLAKRSLAHFYGPFPSRAAADRYADAVLDLFKLRRCYEDLEPYPEHPGCVYQEMKKCLAPCNQACTPEGAAAYAQEAAAVEAFFDTHGESMLRQIAADRDQASADLDFERAAALHTQHQKVKAAAALADDLVQPIPQLRAAIVQKAAQSSAQKAAANPAQSAPEPQAISPDLQAASPDQAAVFLLQSGCLTGPEPLSTLGVRAVKEQTSVGSSLFAQPLMLQAIPLSDPSDPAAPVEAAPADSPELRAAKVLEVLAAHAAKPGEPIDTALLSDHLSLLRRWYYRPEKQRAGEVFLPNADGLWPIRRILNGAARMALGDPAPMAETGREAAKAAAKPAKVKILHAGRPDVERIVPIYDPADPASDRQPDPTTQQPAPDPLQTFTSRRSK